MLLLSNHILIRIRERVHILVIYLAYVACITTLRVSCQKGKVNKSSVLSYGFNYSGDNGGVHAEHDAINNLKPNRRANMHKSRNRLQSVTLLIVRFSRTNKIYNSKPCANCIQNMIGLPERKGYRIRNVYYSNDNGEIIKSDLHMLQNETPYYTRYYRRKRK